MARNHKRPLRHQVRDQLIELLSHGKYKPGNRIPSEPELVEKLDVSRATVREALQLLEQERIIRSWHGSGRFLLISPQNIAVDITKLQSVTDLLADHGIRAKARVLQAVEKPADAEVAQALDLQPGAPIIYIERLRFAEDYPVIYSIDILPCRVAKTPWSPKDFEGSLLVFLEKHWGVRADHARTTIRAVTFDKKLAARAHVSPDTPWILLEQINLSPNGEPIIYSKDYHRGDSITFHVMRYSR